MRNPPNPPKIGQIFNHPVYGSFEVIDYKNSKEVTVLFYNTGTIILVQNKDISSMALRDYMHPNIFGVGYLGYGKYKSYVDGRTTKPYSVWRGMLQRCYDKSSPNYKFYSDCVVCPDWHNFQKFADWYTSMYKNGYHLDKDTTYRGNKLYSPATCALIPMADNVSFATQKQHTFISPKGVTVNFTNLNKFCKANGLDRTKMWALKSGKRKTHKGWTYRES